MRAKEGAVAPLDSRRHDMVVRGVSRQPSLWPCAELWPNVEAQIPVTFVVKDFTGDSQLLLMDILMLLSFYYFCGWRLSSVIRPVAVVTAGEEEIIMELHQSCGLWSDEESHLWRYFGGH